MPSPQNDSEAPVATVNYILGCLTVPFSVGLDGTSWKFYDSVCSKITEHSYGKSYIVCFLPFKKTNPECYWNVELEEEDIFIFTSSPSGIRYKALLPTSLCKNSQVWSSSEHVPNDD